METTFYVGQWVMGQEGQVVIVLDPNHGSDTFKGVLVYGQTEKQPIGHIDSKWAKECFVSFPIYPPRVVLTEWHKKQIASVLNRWVCADYSEEVALKSIESILSSPEPPKYQPKKGEAVLVRDSHIKPWFPAIAFGEEYIVYTPTADIIGWTYCRPFDASLVGQVTSD